jgi:hypothetical protein
MNDLSAILKSIEKSRGYKSTQKSLNEFKTHCALEHKRKLEAAATFKRSCLSELTSHKKKTEAIIKKNNTTINNITSVGKYLEEIAPLVLQNGFKINSIAPSSSVYDSNTYQDHDIFSSYYRSADDSGKFKISITRDIGNGTILNYRGFLTVQKNAFHFKIKEKNRILFWVKYTKANGIEHKNRMLEALLGRKRKICL